VGETLINSADFTIYVRDRKPFGRASPAKAYVLPRTGQRGIPVVSVNTGGQGRDLSHRRPQPDRQRAGLRLPAQSLQLRSRGDRRRARRVKVWSGELEVEKQLNAEVTTAFPVGEAVGDIEPGVYVMTAQPRAT
jgi:alpha-2-macroglobulin